MSAYGTKKAGSDRNLFHTFPLGWQDAWQSQGAPTGYFPSYEGGGFDMLVGDGTHEQERYHEEKRIEADRSVMDGLQARKRAEQKLLTGPHNYHLPKPVLSQRRYANPSYGALSFDSNRRDNGADAPFRTIEVGMEGSGTMRGGVRTNDGYAYYRGQLKNRIGQLDRMNAVAQGYAVPIGQDVETAGEFEGSFAKVQFYTTLKFLIEDVLAGDFKSVKTDKNLTDTLEYLFKYVPTIEDEREFGNILRSLTDTGSALQEVVVDDDYIEELEARGISQKKFETFVELFIKMADYVRGMSEGFYLQPAEKQTLSMSLIKDLGLREIGFQFFGRDAVLVGELRAPYAERSRAENTRYRDAVRRGLPYPDDDDTSSGFDSSGFSRPAAPREDEEADFGERAPFAGEGGDEERERFGRRGARPFDGAAYFGEDGGGAADGGPALVAPLDMAGFDAEAERPPAADMGAVADALETVVENTLEPLKTAEDRDKPLDEVVARHYPQKHVFIGEVERAMEERGFSKAQIAAAMERDGSAVYTDYIADNTGDVGPAAAEPARRFNPLAGAPAPVYDPAAREEGIVPPRGAPAPERVVSDVATVLYARGFPRTREMLRHEINVGVGISKAEKIQRVRRLGMLIPAELGGPYVPREGTDISNAITALIAKIKRIDPAY